MSATNPSAFQSNSPSPAKVSSPSNDLTDTIDQLKLDPLASGRPATPARANSTDKSTARTTGKRAPTKKAAKSSRPARPSSKQSNLIAKPAQTIDEAIASNTRPEELDALLREWSKYNEQQALLKAKADSEALAKSVEARRRVLADKLLAYADSLGITVAAARKIFADELEAQRRGKSK